MEQIERILADAGLDPEVVHHGPGPLCSGCLDVVATALPTAA
jgi:hypothetical protein